MGRTAWRNSHGNKIIHRHWVTAWKHAAELRRKSGERLEPYACCWQDDGTPNGRKHWHVGHTTGARDIDPETGNSGPPAVTRNGMRSMRVYLTEAEYLKLALLAGGMHPNEYAARVILAGVRDHSLLRKVSANSGRNWDQDSSSLSAGIFV